MNKLILPVIVTLFIVACSQGDRSLTGVNKTSNEKTGRMSLQNRPTVGDSYSLEIVPHDAYRSSTLHLIPTGFDPSQAKIEWLVNGMAIETKNLTQFAGTDTRKGNTVQVRALVKDTAVLSNVVQIKNSPPEITRVKILPDVFRPGDNLNVEVEGSDVDGDNVTFLYEWTKNGEPAGKGNCIECSIKRGDKVEVKITPFDGEAYGKPIVLQREIKNLPPMIVDHKDCSFDGKVYTYQVKATDPDGDTLTYALVPPPAGMTIDPSTGLLQWNVPPDFKGNKEVLITVSDGHGGTASYNVTITIQ